MLFISVTFGIPPHEVGQWPSEAISMLMAYYKLEPWGGARADIHNAMQMLQRAEIHRDRKTRPQPYAMTDFWPFNRSKSEGTMRDRMRSAFRLDGKKGN